MKTNCRAGLLGGLLLTLLPATLLSQFPQIKIPLRVSDNSDSSRTVNWGVDPAATIGIDLALGEAEQPPIPPAGALDARCVGDSLGVGTKLDLRKFTSNAQTDTFRIRYQPSAKGGLPIKMKWSRLLVQQYYLSSVRLIDDVGTGGTLLNVDMKSTDSVLTSDTRFNVVRIVATGPLGPNEIRGMVYEDILGDGARAPSDSGISGWTVSLGGDRTDSLLTDSAGAYVFRDLPNGDYTVSVSLPAGWMKTTPASPGYAVSLGGGDVADSLDFGFFQLGSLSGFKFNDANGNRIMDGGEGVLPGWKIHLRGALVDSALTDAGGEFAFTGLGPGTYQIFEQQDPSWFQTLPGAPGYYPAVITSGVDRGGLAFANKPANVYVGSPGGSWSDSTNWSDGHPPGPADAVVIDAPVFVDDLMQDTVLGLRIGEGGSITYTAPESLVVLHSVQIDSGGQLIFQPPPGVSPGLSAAGQQQLVCYGDWINNGEFLAGGSLITMAGDSAKSIGSSTFYDLEIRGTGTSSDGNIGILHTLYLREAFGLRETDTLFVMNPSADAIADSGAVPGGIIQRAIQEGGTLPYRFSDPGTTVAFLPGGDHPDFLLVGCEPASRPPSFRLDWEIVGGTADPGTHTVLAESVSSFSKWALGGPRPQSTYGAPTVDRMYTIGAKGGSGYAADLRLFYDPTEVQPGTDEASLMLLKDPQIRGAVAVNWNLVSVPVEPEVAAKTVLFPDATTSAYRFADGYVESPDLQFGTGYWMKFPGPSEPHFLGEGVDSARVPLAQGWNLIGMISFPVDVGSIVTDPQGIISTRFYGYQGSYTEADLLEPVRGYWVKSSAPGAIILEAGDLSAAKPTAGRDEDVAPGSLKSVDDAGRGQTLLYSATAPEHRGRYELPPVPPPGAFDARFASGYRLEAAVARPTEHPILLSSAEYPVTISWVTMVGGPEGVLRVDGENHALGQPGTVVLHDPAARVSLMLGPTGAVPAVFSLSQCYPNPFNPATTIEYSLPARGHAILVVYNVLGEVVTTLVDQVQEAGQHRVAFDASRLSSGVYFYRLQADRHSSVKRMVLVK